MKNIILIAIFMGWKGAFIDNGMHHDHIITSQPIPPEGYENWDVYVKNLMYDKSWDWLIPVIKKIREITNVELGIHDFECVRDMRLNLNPYDYTKEQVYESSLKFIKWYNNRDVIMSCPHVIRVGESCRLNNDCTYPNCKPLTNNQLLGQSTII